MTDIDTKTTMPTARHSGRGTIRIERGAKRVRAYLGGEVVADTIHPVLVWEVPYYPTYYVPITDVRAGVLHAEGGVAHSPSRGDGMLHSVTVGDRTATGAAVAYKESPIEELRELVRLEWQAMDAWFEEDEEVFTHPRDPYTRVDILPSSRHMRIEVDGVTVAESTKPTLLFETGLPTRYYMPKTAVRLDLLRPSATVTECPYKGRAAYYAVRVGDNELPDLAWTYPTPLPESQRIAGLVAFYDEKVDVYVDGILQERPKTKFT
jgi:uncharacterized protein (DUF427 family)